LSRDLREFLSSESTVLGGSLVNITDVDVLGFAWGDESNLLVTTLSAPGPRYTVLIIFSVIYATRRKGSALDVSSGSSATPNGREIVRTFR
jgi:hypothetical protein